MFYTNNVSPSQFAGLFKCFQEIGIDEKTLRIAAEYLDMTNPRNDLLLEGIQTKDYSGKFEWKLSESLDKCVAREILRTKDEELFDRYILLIHAIAGSCCERFCSSAFAHQEKRSQAYVRALSKRFGSEAQAAALAIRFESLMVCYYFKMPEAYEVSDALTALKYCTAERPAAKILLCIYILANERSDVAAVSKAVAVLENLWDNQNAFWNDDKSRQYLLTASALGASRSDVLKRNFHEKMKGIAPMVIAELAMRLPFSFAESVKQILLTINANPAAENEPYIREMVIRTKQSQGYAKSGEVLHDLAKRYPKKIRAMMKKEDDPAVMLCMDEALRKADPTYKPNETKLCEESRGRCTASLMEEFKCDDPAIAAYLFGNAAIADVIAIADKFDPPKYYWSRKHINYIAGFGLDAFAKRCICLRALAPGGIPGYASATPGYTVKEREAELVDILTEGGVPFAMIFARIGEIVDSSYGSAQVELRDKFCMKLRTMMDDVLALDWKSQSVLCRSIYLEVLTGTPEDCKAQILALADDSSKVIRAELAEFLKKQPAWTEDVAAFLSAKKAAKRELAADVLKEFDTAPFAAQIQAAMENEKKDEIRMKLAALLGVECAPETVAQCAEDLITSLTKGSKAKKVAWLFETPFSPVRKADGADAETAHLQAILLCYANMNTLGVSDTAKQIAAQLDASDLAAFALEVLGRWLEQGAVAKQKWVLYFAAQHGDYEVQTTLTHYIKEWAEHSRGAIAADAVRALAFRGTPEALMAVDQMSRKIKNGQVRSAALLALDQAAEELNITPQELADRIVPNLGFNENLCRVFDFGPREFEVYLTPALELEIFEGDKSRKTLPKPGAKDDPEKAEAASKAFKEMKKQLKTVVTAQKQRLEYVLLCHRTWTAQGWQELFVKNPVMHCFAIGLVWGTYDAQGNLLETFRYMEDGSFNTADEDEFELPEDAAIGLVHPIELEDDLRDTWREQLEDYEITQPFQQITRPVYRIADDEVGQTELLRFVDKKLTNGTLMGRMQKYGWDKGMAQDGGWFYEFTRTDIVRREKDENGRTVNIGNYAELTFSGTSISYYESDDVTTDKVCFYALGGSKDPMPLEQVNRRYFSEVIMQLTAALAAAAEEEV